MAIILLSGAAAACELPDGVALSERPGRAAAQEAARLSADLDGDGAVEAVLPVIRLTDGQKALAICHKDGTLMGTPGLTGRLGQHLDPAYFNRMTYWAVEAAGPIGMGATEEPPPDVVGDKILLGIAETSSVLVFWDGAGFSSYWQGD